MTKDEIMALADAYADHAYNDGVLRLDHADDRTAASRAALEAALASKDALTERQEPVAWELRKGKTDRVLIDITNNPEIAHNWKASLDEVVPLYTHPAPVNQQLLEALKWIAKRCPEAFLKQEPHRIHWEAAHDAGACARAAIAAAEVRRD